MRRIVCFIVACITFCFAKSGDICIVASGETHGMIDACDCEHDPGGGVTRRETLLKQLRKDYRLLLCDAGGFCAGGIYDDYTAGRSADSVRTLKMITTMGAMHYDAVAIGDDDLQYGGKWLIAQAEDAHVPLISANCMIAPDTYLTQPFVIVKKGSVTIGITAVCTSERLFHLDTTVIINDAAPALRKIWKKLCAKSDIQIILSHLGEEESLALARQFNECDVLVNGHRKNGIDPIVKNDAVHILQFGFQGKSLSAIMYNKKASPSFFNVRWYDVTPELKQDSAIAALLTIQPVAAMSQKVTLDLYVMSQCPYGLEALRTYCTVKELLPSLNWNIWFIGSIENDSTFISLRGNDEVKDEMIWLAVKKNYPEKWLAFCKERSSRKGSTEHIIKNMGMNLTKIERWVNRHGKTALRKHYIRSMRQSVDASPTLFVNNKPFERMLNTVNIVRYICTIKEYTGMTICDSLPECSEDSDCRKKGKHGTCSAQGTCTYTDAEKFDFVIVTADTTVQHPERNAITTTEELFPGATIHMYTSSSQTGASLIAKYSPDVLPLYLFGLQVNKDIHFKRIEEGLVQKKGYYTFKKGVAPANYILSRKKIPGRVVLYVDPFFNGIAKILHQVINNENYRKTIYIEPMLFSAPHSVQVGSQEFFRQEEALRWLTLKKLSKDEQFRYLKSYIKNPASSWWPERLSGSSIAPDTLTLIAAKNKQLLEKQWKVIESFGIHEPVLLLKDNVECIAVDGERNFRRMIRMLTGSEF